MKVNASHSIKLPHPDPGIQFGSIGASVSIEGTPPESMDRQELAEYVRALLAEARARTEEHLAQQNVPAPEPVRSAPELRFRGHHRPMRGQNGHRSGNGRPSMTASSRQCNYVQALCRDAGYSPEWSNDGTRIAFVQAGQIYVLTVADKEVAPVTADSNYYSLGAWSADDKRLVLSGYGELSIVDADGLLPPQEIPNQSGLSFGPDW